MTLKNLTFWKNSKALNDTGYVLGDIWYREARMQEHLENKAKAKAAYLASADAYGNLGKGSHLQVSRGSSLERAYSLYKAGEGKRAKQLYEKLAGHYGKEFTFNYGYARLLKNLKEPKKAYRLAKAAERYSYGDNWLRTVGLLAELEIEMGHKKQAIKTIEQALKQAVLPSSLAVRTHRYLNNLRQILAKAKN